MEFTNVYGDAKRAESYAKLEFPGTYYLAFRDLPEIVAEHVRGRRALDFGCGAGRSTRFLRRLGFEAIGIDVSSDMIREAEQIDPAGDYRLVEEGDLAQFEAYSFNLVLSAFAFDNIPTAKKKVKNLGALERLLKEEGKVVNLVSSPDIYKNEWASFTTKAFPENLAAKNGDRVRIVMMDVDDRRPVEDIIWYDDDYQDVFSKAGLRSIEAYRPLGKEHEPYVWVNETRIPPWVIYVLGRTNEIRSRRMH